MVNYPPSDGDELNMGEFSAPGHQGLDNEFIKSLRTEGYLSQTPLDPSNKIFCGGGFFDGCSGYVYFYVTYNCNETPLPEFAVNSPQHYHLLWEYEKHNDTCKLDFGFCPFSPGEPDYMRPYYGCSYR